MMTGTLTRKTEPHQKCCEQEAADDRADGAAGAGDRGPHADGPAPLARVAEDVGEQRQRGRHDQRRADAHERPGEDQLVAWC